jgi:hypothetical protein
LQGKVEVAVHLSDGQGRLPIQITLALAGAKRDSRQNLKRQHWLEKGLNSLGRSFLKYYLQGYQMLRIYRP